MFGTPDSAQRFVSYAKTSNFCIELWSSLGSVRKPITKRLGNDVSQMHPKNNRVLQFARGYLRITASQLPLPGGLIETVAPAVS